MKTYADIPGVRCVDENKERETVKLEHDDWPSPVWVRQDQIGDDSEVYRPGDVGTLYIEEWLAERQCWI